MLETVVVPTPFLILGIFVAIALSLDHVNTNRAGAVGSVAWLINMASVANLALGVDCIIAVSCMFVYPFSRKLYRRLNSYVAQALWVEGTASVLSPAEIVLTGEVPDAAGQAIVIANHQVDADWWYIWEIMRFARRHGQMKIILMAEGTKNLPIIGWAMRGFEFIFLKRNWAHDRDNLQRQLSLFMEDTFPLRLLIFPEGTTCNARSMEKCVAYAKKESRPTFQHLLLPRTTGFNTCTDAFARGWANGRKNGDPGGNNGGTSAGGAREEPIVFDLTIAYTGYSGEIPPWELGFERKVDVTMPNVRKLLRGQRMGPVHIHIEKHSLADVQAGGDGWLDAAWARKDKLLEEFLAKGRFPHTPTQVFTATRKPLSFCILSALPVVFYWLLKGAAGALLTSLQAS